MSTASLVEEQTMEKFDLEAVLPSILTKEELEQLNSAKGNYLTIHNIRNILSEKSITRLCEIIEEEMPPYLFLNFCNEVDCLACDYDFCHTNKINYNNPDTQAIAAYVLFNNLYGPVD